MRVYMQTLPTEDKPPRFYHLHVQQDLLAGWTLVLESGYQGASGRVRRMHFEARDAAVAALEKARDAQIKRGYRVVFAEGESRDT